MYRTVSIKVIVSVPNGPSLYSESDQFLLEFCPARGWVIKERAKGAANKCVYFAIVVQRCAKSNEMQIT